MSETNAPKGNWVEQAVAKIPEEKLPKPEAEEQKPLAEVAEQKPEPKAEEKPAKADDDDDATETLVDLRALKAERGRRKEAERIAREREIEFAKASERLALIQQAWEESQKQAQPKPEQAQAPDKDADPLGYIEFQLNQERQARAQLEEQIRQQQGFTAQQQEIARLHTEYSRSAQNFAAQKADFKQAYDFVWKQLDKEMELRGISDAKMRQQMLIRDEMQFAAMQFQAGRNPAEVIYQMAELRGYRPAEQQEQKPEPVEEVQLQQKRQAAMSPLSNASGKSPSNTTLKDLASLPQEEFIKATKGKNWDKLFRAGSR